MKGSIYMKKEELYNKLLNKLNESENKFIPEDLSDSSMGIYYYKDLRDNCYYTPHKELKKDARAIYSSAAMIYNLLGNNVTINNKNYDVIYEEELDGITPGKGRHETHRAHLDASLRNNNEIIFLESKMTEWLGSPKRLKEAYLNPDNYLPITKDSYFFIDFFKTIIDKSNLTKNGYKSIYKKYDAIQMTIHILGIYNFIKGKKNNNITKISLINCIWGYKEIPQYKIEIEEATKFIEYANKKFIPLFKKIGIDFRIEHYSFHELKELIDFSNDINHKNYLKRYDIEL